MNDEIPLPPPILMYARGGLMWLDHERQRLYNSYHLQDKETLLKLFPDRTWQALKSQASFCKIPRSGKWFTEKEDNLLLELKSEGKTYKEMTAFFLFRTEQSLKNRLYRINKNGSENMEQTPLQS